MKTPTRFFVIGGGIAGCTTLHHLTELGKTDVMLVERDELMSVSTWRTAVNVTQFGDNQSMVAMKRHSINLYTALSKNTVFPFSYQTPAIYDSQYQRVNS